MLAFFHRIAPSALPPCRSVRRGKSFVQGNLIARNVSSSVSTPRLTKMPPIPGTLCLFDVDGTITESRQVIKGSTLAFLSELSQNVTLGLVGGSDYAKALEQLNGVENCRIFEFMFSENGLVARRKGELIAEQNIAKFLGEELVQDLINFCLGYMSQLKLPVKRGTFIEYRSGLINICPVGRSCSQAERKEFAKFDEEHHVRQKFVHALKEKFSDTPLTFSIGGEISIDAYPKGWDKTYCLRFLDEFPTIHFFGDKTDFGGNDHELFTSPRVTGHKVTSPEDTVRQLSLLFK